jgi:hypothetical protein
MTTVTSLLDKQAAEHVDAESTKVFSTSGEVETPEAPEAAVEEESAAGAAAEATPSSDDVAGEQPAVGVLELVGGGLHAVARTVRPATGGLVRLPLRLTAFWLDTTGTVVEGIGRLPDARTLLRKALRWPVRVGVFVGALT